MWLRLRHQILGRRHNSLVLEKVDGIQLLVLPDVFNPVLFRTGTLLSRVAADEIVSSRCSGAPVTVLDLGCGSGIGAVIMARHGCRVVAVDTNPEAIRCTRINALLNNCDEHIEIRSGDLFEPVATRRFDIVLFNPPFYQGQPRNLLDQAWRGADVFERFAAGLADHLAPEGIGLLVLSTDGDSANLLADLVQHELETLPIFERDFGNEVITIYKVRLCGDHTEGQALADTHAPLGGDA
jgi:methylase of polypeptide subunit release factors